MALFGYRADLVQKVENDLGLLKKALQEYRNKIPESCKQVVWLQDRVNEVQTELTAVLYVKRDAVLDEPSLVETISSIEDYSKKVKSYVHEARLLVLMPWMSPPP